MRYFPVRSASWGQVSASNREEAAVVDEAYRVRVWVEATVGVTGRRSGACDGVGRQGAIRGLSVWGIYWKSLMVKGLEPMLGK